MKKIFRWLKIKFIRWIGDLPLSERYPLEVFNKLSKPIIEIINTVKGFEICDEPCSIVGDANAYYYLQTARKRLSDRVTIVVNWQLQDDGWDPYLILDVRKYIRVNSEPHSWIGLISANSIYPSSHQNLSKIIQQVELHNEEFYACS